MSSITVDTVEQWPLSRLIPYAKNARTHDAAQVAQIAASIVEFGFVNPILVGDNNVIIAGHGRLLAAQQLELETVPVIVLRHLSETQRRALVIADNQIASNSGWNEALLTLELSELQAADFDLSLMGFSDAELDELMHFESEHDDAQEDAIPEVDEQPVSQLGDVWLLGEHRVLCGDSTQRASFETLMGEELADMTFQDSPYNVDYGNNAKDKLRGKDRRILNDNLGEDFYEFLFASITHTLAFCKGAVYLAMSSSELDTLQQAFRAAGGKWSTFIVWAKNTFTLGRADYQRQYEPILYGWKDGSDHFWCGARDQGDVWFIDKPHKNDLHPTMKPVALVERAIRNSSKTQDIVLDAFGGSGTTLIACAKTHRRARLIELDPHYVDVIIRRWQHYSGQEAIRTSDGLAFDALAQSSTSISKALVSDGVADGDGVILPNEA